MHNFAMTLASGIVRCYRLRPRYWAGARPGLSRRSRSRRRPRCSCSCWSWRRYRRAPCAITPSGINIRAVGRSAPDDHLTACFASRPHPGMTLSSRWRISGAGRSPRVCAWYILAARVEVAGVTGPSPDDHLCSSPNGRVIRSTVRCDICRRYPTVGNGVVSSASPRETEIIISSAPDDHFTCCPDRRMKFPGRWRVSDGRSCPAIRDGIISPARVQCGEIVVLPAPNDHLGARPHCGVKVSCDRCVSCARRRPGVCVWIVPATSV